MEPIKVENVTFQIIDDPKEKSEIEKILEEERDRAAQYLVEELNQKFFNSVAQWLREQQSIIFTDSDGSRYLIKSDGVKILDDEHIDFVLNKNWRQICTNCKRSIAKMKVTFDKDHLSAAIKAFEYAVKNGQQYVQINQIGLTKQEYAKMNRLVKFGLAFRNEEIKINWSNIGVYWIPRKRINDFVKWQWTVASCFLQDPTLPEGHENKREMSKTRITVDQVPSVSTLREKLGDQLTSYEWNEQDCFE